MATPGRVQDAILEYLRYYQFLHTAECLEAEREQKQLSSGGGAADVADGDGSASLLQAFDSGDEEAFEYLWASVLPGEERDLLPGRRLEFNARLHMAVFGGPGLDAASRMEGFRQFLNGRGKQLSQETSCCAFFALPYCSDVAGHPTFSALLDDAWVAEVRHELDVFVQANARAPRVPALCDAVGLGLGLAPGPGDGAHTSASSPVPPDLIKAVYATAVHAVEALEAVRKDPGLKIPDSFMNRLLHRMEAYGDVVEGAAPYTPDVLPSLDEFEPLAAASAAFVAASDAKPGSEGKAADSSSSAERELEGKSESERDFDSHDDMDADHPDDVFAEAKTEGGDGAFALGDDQIQGDGEGEGEGEGEGANVRLTAAEVANLRADAVVAATLPKAEPLTSPTSPKGPSLQLGFLAEVETPVMAPLDYRKLRADLGELEDLFLQGNAAAERQACLVLQALRWRLSRSPAYSRREAVLAGMTDADFLLVNDADSPSGNLAVRMLAPAAPQSVRLMAARLVSVVCLSAAGRAYLVHCASALVPALVDVLEGHGAAWRFPDSEREGSDCSSKAPESPAGVARNGHGRTLAEAAVCGLQRLSLRGEAADAMAGVSILETAVGSLGQARKRSRFVSEQLAALALNVALRASGAERVAAPEDCADAVARVLADARLPYLHDYMVGLLFALLKNAAVRAVLGDPQSRLYKALKALLRADEHVDSDSDDDGGGGGGGGGGDNEEGEGEEDGQRRRARGRRRRRRQRLAPGVRKQLHYVVGVLDDGSVEEVLAQMQTEREGKEGEGQGQGEGEGGGGGPPADDEDDEEDMAPEEDEHEPEAFRDGVGPARELRGERLLVTSYHQARANGDDDNGDDDEEGKSGETKQDCKSPIMRLVEKSTVPDEFVSNPRVVNTPHATATATATAIDQDEVQDEAQDEAQEP